MSAVWFYENSSGGEIKSENRLRTPVDNLTPGSSLLNMEPLFVSVHVCVLSKTHLWTWQDRWAVPPYLSLSVLSHCAGTLVSPTHTDTESLSGCGKGLHCVCVEWCVRWRGTDRWGKSLPGVWNYWWQPDCDHHTDTQQWLQNAWRDWRIPGSDFMCHSLLQSCVYVCTHNVCVCVRERLVAWEQSETDVCRLSWHQPCNHTHAHSEDIYQHVCDGCLN